MKQSIGKLLLALLVLGSGPLASAQILRNGGFEQNDGVALTADFNVDANADSVLIGHGETHITAVEVSTDPARGVYYISDPTGTDNPEGDYFVWLSGAPFDCVQFDLVNSGVNTPLVNGTTYEVSFFAAAFDVTMDVNYVPTAIPAQTSSPFLVELQRQDFSYDVLATVSAPASVSYGDMNWNQYSYLFFYDNGNPDTHYINLVLSSQSENEGIAIDNVQLNVVPEPGVAGFLLLSILCLALRRRCGARAIG